MGMEVPAALAPVVDLVFPPRCPLCGAALARQGGYARGAGPNWQSPVSQAAPPASVRWGRGMARA
ncbi:hypothetical protein [Novosphingobium sp.]|uniref:hypothetical protein n=1 Tax=Novosphingobium sp. TaxID=1874826 RepID=UPI003438E526